MSFGRIRLPIMFYYLSFNGDERPQFFYQELRKFTVSDCLKILPYDKIENRMVLSLIFGVSDLPKWYHFFYCFNGIIVGCKDTLKFKIILQVHDRQYGCKREKRKFEDGKKTLNSKEVTVYERKVS